MHDEMFCNVHAHDHETPTNEMCCALQVPLAHQWVTMRMTTRH